ncbi:hypothetical protein D3C78_1608850 [compost metagenome]
MIRRYCSGAYGAPSGSGDSSRLATGVQESISASVFIRRRRKRPSTRSFSATSRPRSWLTTAASDEFGLAGSSG